MKILKSKEVDVSPEDDFLYVQLQRLFEQIKLTQGGTELAYTLRNHQKLKNYAIAKQIEQIKYIEEKYFTDDGSLNQDAIHNFHIKNYALQNN